MEKNMDLLVGYMRAHWPSLVPQKWRVKNEQYEEIVGRIIRDFSAGATRNKQFFRISGQSGSGKTTQLLPAVERWFEVRDGKPILVAARKFVEYHPFAKEIESEYGEENLRKMTDEVSTILMFLTLRVLIAGGYDIILDVTLLDPLVEGVLMNMLESNSYEIRMTMVAVAKEISDEFILRRQGRVVAKHTAEEFWRATRLALDFYAEEYAGMPIVVWNVWDREPVFDGKIGDDRAREVINEYWGKSEMGKLEDAEKLKEAKLRFFEEYGERKEHGSK